VRVPLAYALNGVKGFSVSLNRRRNYADTPQCSLAQARINRRVLDSLIGVMETSLPDFRRYLRLKAKLLGVKRLAFFDLFAPLSSHRHTWSFKRAGRFIIDCFSGFSPELGEFARRALAENWIDARPRPGKVGGAYCISLPVSGESRVLSNYDGSFSAVTTLAHELGHAYHHHLLRKDTAIHRDYPMTLAETASIFSENIIINNAVKTLPKEEKINLLEQFLADSTQVIVDILSRYYFESELLRLREQKELSADELNGLMFDAQRKTYGSALDPKLLHPYMWAVKGHYYRAELAFYNYPYAFGLLFGLGLHALYTEQGAGFPAVYASLLKNTGRMNCMELTNQVGFDIESPAFWRKGIAVIKERIDEFEKLAGAEKG
jgi:oligoendopeptidase F